MEQGEFKNGTFFRFEDLRVYHKALDYIDWVYTNTRLFPDDNTSLLAERFVKSAQAIALYIAEGSARNKNQFIHYLKMAKSSVRECVVITTLAEKQNLLSEMLIMESRNELMELTKMLGALIGSLQKPGGKGKLRNKYDDGEPNYQSDREDELISSDSIDVKKY